MPWAPCFTASWQYLVLSSGATWAGKQGALTAHIDLAGPWQSGDQFTRSGVEAGLGDRTKKWPVVAGWPIG